MKPHMVAADSHAQGAKEKTKATLTVPIVPAKDVATPAPAPAPASTHAPPKRSRVRTENTLSPPSLGNAQRVKNENTDNTTRKASNNADKDRAHITQNSSFTVDAGAQEPPQVSHPQEQPTQHPHQHRSNPHGRRKPNVEEHQPSAQSASEADKGVVEEGGGRESENDVATVPAEAELECESCGVKQSPQWRTFHGVPGIRASGAVTLCNACGVRFARFGDVRAPGVAEDGERGAAGGAVDRAPPRSPERKKHHKGPHTASADANAASSPAPAAASTTASATAVSAVPAEAAPASNERGGAPPRAAVAPPPSSGASLKPPLRAHPGPPGTGLASAAGRGKRYKDVSGLARVAPHAPLVQWVVRKPRSQPPPPRSPSPPSRTQAALLVPPSQTGGALEALMALAASFAEGQGLPTTTSAATAAAYMANSSARTHPRYANPPLSFMEEQLLPVARHPATESPALRALNAFTATQGVPPHADAASSPACQTVAPCSSVPGGDTAGLASSSQDQQQSTHIPMPGKPNLSSMVMPMKKRYQMSCGGVGMGALGGAADKPATSGRYAYIATHASQSAPERGRDWLPRETAISPARTDSPADAHSTVGEVAGEPSAQTLRDSKPVQQASEDRSASPAGSRAKPATQLLRPSSLLAKVEDEKHSGAVLGDTGGVAARVSPKSHRQFQGVSVDPFSEAAAEACLPGHREPCGEDECACLDASPEGVMAAGMPVDSDAGVKPTSATTVLTGRLSEVHSLVNTPRSNVRVSPSSLSVTQAAKWPATTDGALDCLAENQMTTNLSPLQKFQPPGQFAASTELDVNTEAHHAGTPSLFASAVADPSDTSATNAPAARVTNTQRDVHIDRQVAWHGLTARSTQGCVANVHQGKSEDELPTSAVVSGGGKVWEEATDEDNRRFSLLSRATPHPLVR